MPKSQDPLVDDNNSHYLNKWIAGAERARHGINKQKNRGEQNGSGSAIPAE